MSDRKSRALAWLRREKSRLLDASSVAAWTVVWVQSTSHGVGVLHGFVLGVAVGLACIAFAAHEVDRAHASLHAERRRMILEVEELAADKVGQFLAAEESRVQSVVEAARVSVMSGRPVEVRFGDRVHVVYVGPPVSRGAN